MGGLAMKCLLTVLLAMRDAALNSTYNVNYMAHSRRNVTLSHTTQLQREGSRPLLCVMEHWHEYLHETWSETSRAVLGTESWTATIG